MHANALCGARLWACSLSFHSPVPLNRVSALGDWGLSARPWLPWLPGLLWTVAVVVVMVAALMPWAMAAASKLPEHGWGMVACHPHGSGTAALAKMSPRRPCPPLPCAGASSPSSSSASELDTHFAQHLLVAADQYQLTRLRR